MLNKNKNKNKNKKKKERKRKEKKEKIARKCFDPSLSDLTVRAPFCHENHGSTPGKSYKLNFQRKICVIFFKTLLRGPNLLRKDPLFCISPPYKYLWPVPKGTHIKYRRPISQRSQGRIKRKKKENQSKNYTMMISSRFYPFYLE